MVLSTVSKIESGADRLTHFAQRFELPDRLRQLARPRLQFLEQPDVLNGDHRLISEGFKQRDLLLGERADFRAADRESTPIGIPSRSNGVAKHGPDTPSLVCLYSWKFGF